MSECKRKNSTWVPGPIDPQSAFETAMASTKVHPAWKRLILFICRNALKYEECGNLACYREKCLPVYYRSEVTLLYDALLLYVEEDMKARGETSENYRLYWCHDDNRLKDVANGVRDQVKKLRKSLGGPQPRFSRNGICWPVYMAMDGWARVGFGNNPIVIGNTGEGIEDPWLTFYKTMDSKDEEYAKIYRTECTEELTIMIMARLMCIQLNLTLAADGVLMAISCNWAVVDELIRSAGKGNIPRAVGFDILHQAAGGYVKYPRSLDTAKLLFTYGLPVLDISRHRDHEALENIIRLCDYYTLEFLGDLVIQPCNDSDELQAIGDVIAHSICSRMVLQPFYEEIVGYLLMLYAKHSIPTKMRSKDALLWKSAHLYMRELCVLISSVGKEKVNESFVYKFETTEFMDWIEKSKTEVFWENKK